MKAFYEEYLKPYIEDDAIVLCVIFLFALFLRLIFIPHLIFDPAFIHPVVDCKEHNDLAFQILNIDNWRIEKFNYHTPGYAYFVAVVYKILGHSIVRLAVVQSILGSLCAGLLYFIIKRMINRWAALFGAFLMSIYWFLIYTQLHVYSENLSMLLNLLMFTVLLFFDETWRKYFLGGLLLGLSVVVRPEMLPFAGVFFIWFLIKKLSPAKIALYYLLFITGVGLCVLPLMYRNYQISGNFLIREQIGVNFYMGSMPKHKGSNIYVTIGYGWQDVISLPYREMEPVNRNLTEKEINDFYKRKVFQYALDHPLEWGRFMVGKIFSVIIGVDFMRTEDVYFYDKYIRSTPFMLIQTWLISILAVLGLVLSFKEPKKYALLYLYFLSYLPAMFFTYKTRYLISHMPLIIIFSSYAFAAAGAALKEKNIKLLAALACAGAALYGCVKWNPVDIVWPSKSEMHYVIGLNFDFYEDHDNAETHYKKALELDSENVTALRELGVLYMKTGDFQRAVNILENAWNIFDDQAIRDHYYNALDYLENGGVYNPRDYYPREFIHHIDLYHYYFPHPYQGPVYQKKG